MSLPVLIEQTGGQYCASVIGSPLLRSVRPSREAAIAALQEQLAQKIAAGELIDLDLPMLGVSGFAGVFKDDPTLREICTEIYRERDADPNR